MLTNSEMAGRRILELIYNIKFNRFKQSVFILPKFFDYRYFQTYRDALQLEDEDLNTLELLADALNHNDFIETLDLSKAALKLDAMMLLIDLLETNTRITKIYLPEDTDDEDQENTVEKLLNKIHLLCFNNKIRMFDRKQKEQHDKKEECELVIGESDEADTHQLQYRYAWQSEEHIGERCENNTHQLQYPYSWQLSEEYICQLFDFLEQHPCFTSLKFHKVPFQLKVVALESDDDNESESESEDEENAMDPIIEIFKKRLKENRTVKKLIFTKCRFSTQAMKGLGEGIEENAHLQVLEFDHNRKGQFLLANPILAALYINRTIRTFSWNCKVTYDGICFDGDTDRILEKVLIVNKTLTHLSLRETGEWQTDDMKILLRGLSRNTSLRSLDLSGWDFRFFPPDDLSERWRTTAVRVFKKLRYLNLASGWPTNLTDIDLFKSIEDKNCRLERLLFTINYDPRNIERLSEALSKNQSLNSLYIMFCTSYVNENHEVQTPTEALKSMAALLPPILRRHPKLRNIEIGIFNNDADESDLKLKDEVLSTLQTSLQLVWNFNVFLTGTLPSQPMKPNPSPIYTAFANSTIYDPRLLGEIAEMCLWRKIKVPKAEKVPAEVLEDNTMLDDNPRPHKKMK